MDVKGPSPGPSSGRHAAILCTVAMFGSSPLLAQGPHMLRVHPPVTDVARALRAIGDQQAPFGAVVVDVCGGGMTLFPVKDSLFATRPGYDDGAALAQWIDQAHALGLRFYAGASLLKWWTPLLADPDPTESRVELWEVWEEPRGGSARVPDGRFVSPWNPKVHESLVALARELGTRYPALDGFYFEAGLSDTALLGFSDQARLAYIDAVGIDPEDLNGQAQPGSDARSNEWQEWRLAQAGELLRAVIAAYRGPAGAGKQVLYETTGPHSSLGRVWQAYSLEDWLPLAVDGQVDGLAFKVARHHGDPAGDHQRALDVVGRCRMGIPVYTVLSGDSLGAATPLVDGYAPIASRRLVGSGWIFDVYSDLQLTEAFTLLKGPGPEEAAGAEAPQ